MCGEAFPSTGQSYSPTIRRSELVAVVAGHRVGRTRTERADAEGGVGASAAALPVPGRPLSKTNASVAGERFATAAVRDARSAEVTYQLKIISE
jgi:hypothetical protein